MFPIQEKKFILAIAIIAFLFILINGLIVFPQYKKIQSSNQQITALREDLEKHYEKAKQYRKSRTNLTETKKITEEVNQYFLKKGEEIKLITILEDKAETLELTQELKLNSNYLKLANKLSSINLDISITGNYSQAVTYLNFLQKNTFYLTLDRVTITRSPILKTNEKEKNQTDSSTPVTFNIKTTVYVQE